MTVTVALVCVGLGYVIGYLRGWQRGVEHTRTYIDVMPASWREAQRRREQTSEEIVSR